MPDWSLLRTPNFAQAALSGYMAGAEVRRQKVLDAAAERKAKQEEQASALIAQALGRGAPQTPASPAPQALGTPTAQPDPIDQYMPGNGITTPAQPAAEETAAPSIPRVVRRDDGLSIDMNAIRQLASIPGQADTAMRLYQFAQTADKQNLEKVQRHLSVKANAADYLLSIPVAQRAEAFQQIAPELLAQGFTQDELAAADLSDNMLNRDRLMGMSIAERRDANRIHWVARPGQGGALIPTDSMGRPIGGETERQANPEADAQIPGAAIDYLRKNPSLAPDFDAKYGAGAAVRVMGGASQPGSRGFP